MRGSPTNRHSCRIQTRFNILRLPSWNYKTLGVTYFKIFMFFPDDMKWDGTKNLETYPCSVLLGTIGSCNQRPAALIDLRFVRNHTKNGLSHFISVKPPHASIIDLEMILPVLVCRVATNGVKDRLNPHGGGQFDPGRYGDRSSWYSFEGLAVE